MPAPLSVKVRQIFFGRHLLGISAIFFAILTLLWRDFDLWQEIGPLGNISRMVLALIFAAVEILGGLAIQWVRTARLGAALLAGVTSILAILCIPPIVSQPLVYNNWGNFFEVSSQVAGALIVFSTVRLADSARPPKLARGAYFFFGVCVISFTLAQIIYFSITVNFVPKWIPPGRPFWAIVTTIAFALAAMTLLSGRFALPASRLLTGMLVGFGFLVWLPAAFSNPHSLANWAGNAQNLAVAAVAWIVADFLSHHGSPAPAVI